MTTITNAQFLAVHVEAAKASAAAALAENAAPGDERSRGLDCGFAWVTLRPANHPFVRALKSAGIGSKGYPSGWQLWASTALHREGAQSIRVRKAAADAYVKALQDTVTTIGQVINSGLEVTAG